MRCDHSLFIREDGVERAWEVLQPVLDRPAPIAFYDRSSWGPAEADALIAPRKWHVSGDDDAPDYHSEPHRSSGVPG
jgi:glucose-6-phosphate 1-dehydrogenase